MTYLPASQRIPFPKHDQLPTEPHPAPYSLLSSQQPSKQQHVNCRSTHVPPLSRISFFLQKKSSQPHLSTPTSLSAMPSGPARTRNPCPRRAALVPQICSIPAHTIYTAGIEAGNRRCQRRRHRRLASRGEVSRGPNARMCGGE